MSQELEQIPVILTTTLGTDEWELSLPLDIPVQALIVKFVRESELPFSERDGAGNAIPYRLMWKEGNRYLAESETLRGAGVQPDNTLVMTQEARAGRGRARRRGGNG